MKCPFFVATLLTICLTTRSCGWYKSAPIAALRQAKFYPPRQAAAPQRLVYCGAAVDKPQKMSNKKSLSSTAARVLRPY